jgi:hypothetical protein
MGKDRIGEETDRRRRGVNGEEELLSKKTVMKSNKPITRHMTCGTHLSGRTKSWAETVLALILGRDRDRDRDREVEI